MLSKVKTHQSRGTNLGFNARIVETTAKQNIWKYCGADSECLKGESTLRNTIISIRDTVITAGVSITASLKSSMRGLAEIMGT